MPSDERNRLISALLQSAEMQMLWSVQDRGMPVYVHTIDVALLCLDEIRGRSGFDVDAIIVGVLIHDYSKLSAAHNGGASHSLIMRTRPDDAADESMALLQVVERDCGVALPSHTRAHVRHIVLSHHGMYGIVQPRTPEAQLVADCDYVSGTQHRLSPIDANDILPLLSEGYRWPEAAAMLEVSRDLVKKRLREACDAEGVRQWIDLLPRFRRDGRVIVGSPERARQLARAKLVTRLSRDMPHALLEQLPDATPMVSSLA